MSRDNLLIRQDLTTIPGIKYLRGQCCSRQPALGLADDAVRRLSQAIWNRLGLHDAKLYEKRGGAHLQAQFAQAAEGKHLHCPLRAIHSSRGFF